MARLKVSYYRQDNVIVLARDLIGKTLHTYIDKKHCSGIITEAEAYNGVADRACHAYGGRFTHRTKTMFEAGGVAYVYICYGIHHLFNIVTGAEGNPTAVLIRGVKALEGIPIMEKRRAMKHHAKSFTSGPGSLSVALGISTKLNALSLLGDKIWLEEGSNVSDEQVKIGPRIGCESAGADGLLPYRFLWENA